MLDSTLDLFDLSGCKAIVLGGNGLVGRSCIKALHMYGAHVFTASRSVQTTRDNNSRLSTYSVDATCKIAFTKFLDFVADSPGDLTCLINCSVVRPMTRFLEDTLENWDASIINNARLVYVPSLLFARSVLGDRPASVVNISSIYGCVGPNQSLYEGCDFETEPDYPYNKHGMIGLTKYFASKYAKTNIRFNAIALGGVLNSQSDAFKGNYERRCPMGRLCVPDEIMTGILYLCSRYSSYTNGSVLSIDGGWTAS